MYIDSMSSLQCNLLTSIYVVVDGNSQVTDNMTSSMSSIIHYHFLNENEEIQMEECLSESSSIIFNICDYENHLNR